MSKTLRDHVSRLEETIGVLQEGEATPLLKITALHETRLQTLEASLSEFMGHTNERLEIILSDFERLTSTVTLNVGALKEELESTGN